MFTIIFFLEKISDFRECMTILLLVMKIIIIMMRLKSRFSATDKFHY